jgi:biotin transport system substrate-specific component
MSTVAQPVVFSDVVPLPKVNAKVRDAVFIVGFALLTAALAQVSFHLSWTPVPVTLQTLGVIVAGGVLGSKRGFLSQALYIALGLFMPFYAGGDSGWSVFSGADGGYLVGMAVSAYLVGLLAERKEDRNFLTSIPAMLFGSAIVYVFGAPWLAHIDHMSARVAINEGVAPFVFGDALKSLAAGALLPLGWKLVSHSEK